MRVDNWPRALTDCIESQSKTVYKLGENDCVRFCCAAVESITGRDLWPNFSGKYTTRAEALELLRAMKTDMPGAVSALTGFEPIPITFAQRGDLVLYADADGKHMAICTGTHAAAFRIDGFIYLPMASCQSAWRVA